MTSAHQDPDTSCAPGAGRGGAPDASLEATCRELVELTAQALRMPVAGVVVPGEGGERLGVRVGLTAAQIPAEASMHALAERSEQGAVIGDLRREPSMHGSALVVGASGLRTCGAVPVPLAPGSRPGVLYVAAHHPGGLTSRQHALLRSLARQAGRTLALHRASQAPGDPRRGAGGGSADLLASVSHELRTPLSAIIGFTSILRRNKRGTLGALEQDYLQRIQTNGAQLLRLVNDLLDRSKVESGQVEIVPRSCDLVALVRSALHQLEQRVGEVVVGFSPPARVRAIEADPHRLQQVVLNLLVNAIKFSDQGHVEVRIVTDPSGAPLRLDVVDDGIGIEPSDQETIFERYGQAQATRGRAQSWGLGLYLSQTLCMRMGFSIAVASEPGVGAAFGIVLDPRAPRLAYSPPSTARGPSPSGGAPRPLAGPARGAEPTVLVVDDDADARTVLERYVEEFGCRVVAVDSGERAVEIARKIVPSLITLDLRMPGVDGFTVLERLRREPGLARIPVAVCSMVDLAAGPVLPGVRAVLDKPIDRRRFLGMLEQTLRRDASEPVLILEPDGRRGRTMAHWVESAGGSPRVVHDEVHARDLMCGCSPSLALVRTSTRAGAMIPALRRAVSAPRLPIVVYGATSGATASLAPGVSVLVKEPESTDIEALLATHLRGPNGPPSSTPQPG